MSETNYWPTIAKPETDICISGDLSVEYDAVNDRYSIGIKVIRDNHVFAASAVLDGPEWAGSEHLWTCAIWSVVWQRMLAGGYSE